MSETVGPVHGARDLALPGRNGNQNSRALVYLEPVDSGPEVQDQGRGMQEYWQVLRRRKLSIALCVALGVAAAAAYSLLSKPRYEALATVEVQGFRDTGGLVDERASDMAQSPEIYLQTQVKVLQSHTLRKRVESVLRARGRRYEVPDPIAKWRAALHLSASEPTVAAFYQVKLQIRIASSSRVLEIRSDAPNAQLAADFANVLANEYIDSTLENSWQSAQRTSGWLTRQLEEMRKKLEESENALQAYSHRSDLLYTGDRQTVDEDRLKQLQEGLSRATVDRITKQAVFEVAGASPLEAVPAVADNGRMNEYRTKLGELTWNLADLSALYTPSHYKVKQIQAQIAELESMLKQERHNILSRIENEYRAAAVHEQMLSKLFAAQLQEVTSKGNKAVYYGILKRDVDTNRQLYEQLLQRVKQVGISSALRASHIRVLDPAETPSFPFHPSPIRNTVLGAAAGLFVALALVLGGEFVNRTVNSPGESYFHLGVPELGVIPSRASIAVRTEGTPSQRLLAIRANGEADPLELITWRNRPSLMAESFRSALASILVAKGLELSPRVLLVTSPSRGEGKSSVVTNLGIALAEINQRVLLVDADMRKPRLHEIFELPNSWGLSDLLKERHSLAACPLEALARVTKVEGLWVLPAGPGTASIANLLYSKRLPDLIERLRADFDVVLLDTPPMTYLFDARVLGRVADGAILILRAGQTTRDAALQSKRRLHEDGIPLLGTILNCWDAGSKHRYGYYPDSWTSTES